MEQEELKENYDVAVEKQRDGCWSVDAAIRKLDKCGISSYEEMRRRFRDNDNLDEIKRALGDESYAQLKKYLLNNYGFPNNGDGYPRETVIEFESDYFSGTFGPHDPLKKLKVIFDRINAHLTINKGRFYVDEKNTEEFFRELERILVMLKREDYTEDCPHVNLKITYISGLKDSFIQCDTGCTVDLRDKIFQIVNNVEKSALKEIFSIEHYNDED